MSTIVEKIGVPALLEQTAEECCELAQACLKMTRKLRDENPTPKSIEDIRDNLVEEMADVALCITLIEEYTDITNIAEVMTNEMKKLNRWHERLDAHINLGEL